jgi:hypothetical protein
MSNKSILISIFAIALVKGALPSSTAGSQNYAFISKASGSLFKDEMKALIAEMQVRGFPPMRRKNAGSSTRCARSE